MQWTLPLFCQQPHHRRYTASRPIEACYAYGETDAISNRSILLSIMDGSCISRQFDRDAASNRPNCDEITCGGALLWPDATAHLDFPECARRPVPVRERHQRPSNVRR